MSSQRSGGDANGRPTMSPMRSISRCLDVLEFLADGEVSLSEISEQLELPVSTVHRILITLIGRGYVVRTPRGQGYALGYSFLQLADQAGNKARYLKTIAYDILKDASATSNETVNLAILSNYKAIYVADAHPSRSVQVRLPAGHQVALYCTAVGKAMLSSLDDEELEWYLRGAPFPALTENTLTTADQLLDDIKNIKSVGYAVDNEENDGNVTCIASVVVDPSGSTLGAVSISAPAGRIHQDDISKLGELAVLTAGAIEKRIGA